MLVFGTMGDSELEACLDQLYKLLEDEFDGIPNVDASPVALLKKAVDKLEQGLNEYLKTEPDLADCRRIARYVLGSSLPECIEALQQNSILLEKVAEQYVLHGGDNELVTAAACFVATVFPLVDDELSSFCLRDIDDMVEFLFEKSYSAERPLSTYCLSVLISLLEDGQSVLKYKMEIIRLVGPVFRRVEELAGKLVPEHALDIASTSRLAVRSTKRLSLLADQDHQPSGKRIRGASRDNPTRAVTAAAAQLQKSLPGSGNGPADQRSATSSPSTSVITTITITAPSLPLAAVAMTTTSTIGESNGNPSSSSLEDASVVSDVPAADEPNASPSDTSEVGEFALSVLAPHAELVVLVDFLHAAVRRPELQPYVLPMVVKHHLLRMIMHFIRKFQQNEQWLTIMHCLKLLGELVCHKKFAMELVNSGGLAQMLEVPTHRMASSGVTLALSEMSDNNHDLMERMYQILQAKDEQMLKRLVLYAVNVLECGHISARVASCYFLSNSFFWPAVLDNFVQDDGLRKLLNQASTLSILSGSADDTEYTVLDYERVRSMLLTLQCFLFAQIQLIADNTIEYISSLQDSIFDGQQSMTARVQKLRSELKMSTSFNDFALDHVATLIMYWPTSTQWAVVELLRLGGMQLLLHVVLQAPSWKTYACRAEVTAKALECIFTLALLKVEARLALCQTYHFTDDKTHVGMRLILMMCEASLLEDSTVQQLALQIICCCVCPDEHVNQTADSGHGSPYSLKLQRIWKCVRAHDGIRVLVQLLGTRMPPSKADSIRALACMALCGISRSPEVRQILSKLPLLNSGQLLTLMAEPIAPNRSAEHSLFCSCAAQLIERVTAKPVAQFSARESSVASLSQLKRAEVVAHTHVSYPRDELLKLIHKHLLAEGLPTAAEALQSEANLTIPAPITPQPSTPGCTTSTDLTPGRSLKLSKKKMLANSSPGQRFSATPAPTVSSVITSPGPSRKTSFTSGPVSPRPDLLIKTPASVSTSKMPLPRSHSPSLDEIVTHYLRHQHSQCRHPMAVCPPFSLSRPHQCPVPRYLRHASVNISRRILQREIVPRYGGLLGHHHNRRFVYSRYRPAITVDNRDDHSYSSAAFMPGDQRLLLGTHAGELHLFTIVGDLVSTIRGDEFECHSNQITMIVPSKSGDLILTSAVEGPDQTALWRLENDTYLENKRIFTNGTAAEFGKRSQERIIVTTETSAEIYDTMTGQCTMRLPDPAGGTKYTCNIATFHPSDDLALSNGVLWDVRCPPSRVVHQFDNFNSAGSGLFQPRSGLEVIINSEIWDLRSFDLLHTCPQLDQCHLLFNHSGDVLFGVRRGQENDQALQDSTVHVVDAHLYSPIATVPMKKNIFNINISWNDSCLAIVENHSNSDRDSMGSNCRLHHIGQQNLWPEEVGEMEPEDPDDTDHDDNSDSLDPNFTGLDFYSGLDGDGDESDDDDDSMDDNDDDEEEEDSMDDDDDDDYSDDDSDSDDF